MLYAIIFDGIETEIDLFEKWPFEEGEIGHCLIVEPCFDEAEAANKFPCSLGDELNGD